MFKFKITWYYDTEEEVIEGIAVGKTYAEAVANLIKDYGESNIVDMYLFPIEDSSTIELLAIKECFNL